MLVNRVWRWHFGRGSVSHAANCRRPLSPGSNCGGSAPRNTGGTRRFTTSPSLSGLPRTCTATSAT
ncbi:MAG: hypothetical protein ACK5HA_04565 [Planctomycetaceae bacterium]